jgi:hypothetical protein
VRLRLYPDSQIGNLIVVDKHTVGSTLGSVKSMPSRRTLRYFGCRFEELFEVVLIDPDTKREQVLKPKRS